MSMLRSTFAPVVFVDDERDRNCVAYRVDPADPDNTAKWRVLWDWQAYVAGQGITDPPDPPEWDPPEPPGPIVTVPHGPTGLSGKTIKVTDASDGEFVNRGYSYWSQAWVTGDVAHVFAGHVDGHPRFFSVNLTSGTVARLEARLSYTGTGEGWYWDAEGWIYLIDGPRLRRVNPFSGEDLIVFDISETHPGCDLWQAHSSDDGRTHSATVRQVVNDGAYPKIGSAAFRDGILLNFFPPTLGEIDESAISGNGRYLLIKETADAHNRIIDLETGTERVTIKSEGALGHSDMGPDYAIGDDRTVGGATRINLANPDDRRVLVRFPDWNMGHVSIKGGRCLLTHAKHIATLDPNTGGVHILAEHGMTGTDYDYQVMGNLDPTGQVACWMSNAAGRMDLYVRVL